MGASSFRKFPVSIKNVLKWLYKKGSPPARTLIRVLILSYEGGQYWSPTIREIYREVHNIHVGMGSYGCFVPIVFPRGTIVGNYCSIAENVRLIGTNHPINFASTHPMFYNKDFGFVDRDMITKHNTVIGHDVWIGYNSLILSKCQKIGIGAVVAAGSVVTKDVDPYTIVAGVPARPVKKRFSDELIEKLIASEWYLLAPEQLGKLVLEAQEPEKFIDAVNRLKAALAR